MSAIREQTALQVSAEAASERPASSGAPLAAVVAQARRRGMATLPAYLTVGLVQQLCRALQQAHADGAAAMGELNLETIQVGFDGRVRPTAFGEARRDVAAAALVLDQLLGETLDVELTRIIGEARAREPTITTALALEQRLAHWQVKQRQLFPGQDLTAAFTCWLFPEAAGATPAPEVKEWFEAQCTEPIAEEPERPLATSPQVNWRWIGGAAVLLLGVVLVFLMEALVVKQPEPGLQPLPRVVVPAPVVAVTPVIQPLPETPEPALPRTATGAPANIKLSSAVHGVRLESSGFPLTAPSKRWAVKVVPQLGKKKAPRYASLFVAELGDRAVARLSRVGPTDWLVLRSPEARLFLMQTDQPADDGSFSLAVGPFSAQGIAATELREDVLTDAMTQVEYSRFVLDGLEVDRVYEVTQRPEAKGATPPVIATVTIPKLFTRQSRGAGFKQAGAPLDQVLLQPGAPVVVTGVSRLSFVVLTTTDAAELFSTVDVVPRGRAPQPRGSPMLQSCRQYAPKGVDCSGLEQLDRGKR